MDAAQKLSKIAILTTTALLLAHAGLAQSTPALSAPSAVTISRSSGQDIVVSSTGAAITFTIGVAYADDNAGNQWLRVTNSGLTTPAALSFNASTAPLTEGSHQAFVTLTPTSPASVSPLIITVTYTGAATGGGSILTATPSPVNLTAPLNTTTAATSVSISTSGGANQTITNVTSSATWLSATLITATVQPSSPGSISVTASSSGLSAGSYSANITVSPSSGTALVIPVNFTVTGGTNTGSWTVSPNPVNFNYTTGGGFPTQVVMVTPPSGAATYRVVVSSSNGWLLVSDGNSDGTTYDNVPIASGFILKIGSQVNALAAATYTGQATLSDANGNQYTLNVNLTVNGGNSSGLTVTPSPLTFSANVGGGQQSHVVSLSSNVGGNVTVGPSGVTPAWLSATGPFPASVVANQNSTFTVTVTPTLVSAAGTYSGDIAVSIGGQSAILTVTLVVGGGSGGTSGTSAIAPTAMQFTYQFGTNAAAVAQQKLVITGGSGAWSTTVSSNSPWLKVTPASGNALPDPEVQSQAPVVSIDPTNLTVGAYSGVITVSAPGGNTNVQVSLNVVSGPILLPTPGSLIFTAQTSAPKPAGQLVFFSDSDNTINLGTSVIDATTTTSWIKLSGLTQNGVLVSVDATGMSTGVYSGSVSVTQAGAGNSPLVVPVVMVVNGGGSGGGTGTLSFSQSAFSFSTANGVTTPSNANLTVSAISATSFVGSISYSPNNAGNWLTVSPLSGVTTTTLSLSASGAGLTNGVYNATISFNVNGTVQTIPVTLTVSSSSGGNTGNVNVSPTSLTFSAVQGSNPAAQSINVTSASGTAGIGFTVQVTAGGSWLSTSANSGNSAPSSFTVNINSAGLAAGQYSGNIQVSPNGGTTVNIPVSLTVTSPATVSATPTSLSFDYRLGDTAPAAKTLTVSGNGGTLTFSATPTSTGNWLVVSPATGTTPGSVNVTVNPSAFTATGTLTGTVTVAGSGGAPGSTTVNVTVNVTAPLPTVTKVTNAASYATGSIAPGEIITLFASDPTHPIGPATAAGLTLDSSGKVATTIGGVQVLVNGFPCPMIYASATQVSAVVPYEIKLFTSASVSVKFLGQSSNGVPVNVATTQPGIFTAGGIGSGQGAILNSNGVPNSASTPATRGDTIVVYLTGEGETSPFGVTGKVTTVAAAPAPLTPAPLLPISVTVGGAPANWSFAGEAPGFVSGVLQLNVVVPTGIGTGDQPIQVTIGGNPTQTGVTVALR